MKITNRYDVPAELNEKAINDQAGFGLNVREIFAKNLMDHLPELILKGGEDDTIFYEESIFIYSEEAMDKVRKLLMAIFQNPHADNVQGLLQLIQQELGSEKL